MAPNTELHLGFLAVEVNIHRPPRDPWNKQTWPFLLIYEIVPASKESQIVMKEQYDEAFIKRFVEAGKKLADRGAVGLITSCGFLAMTQPKLAERLPIPISTSALVQIPSVLAFLPSDKLIGVLTYDGARLGSQHLQQLYIDPKRVRIRDAPPDGYLRKAIQDGVQYDETTMEQEMVNEAVELMKSEEEKIHALELGCTQMPPYAQSKQGKVGVPVYDVHTMGLWFYSGLVRCTPVAWRISKGSLKGLL